MSKQTMTYISTRGGAPAVTGAEAVCNGIAPDGGLYVPSRIPTLTLAERKKIAGASYEETALLVIRKYLPELPDSVLSACIASAYRPFGKEPALRREAEDGIAFLELWHGPTAAFKDMALQLFPRLLSACKQVCGTEETTWILTATSGDTGKAALEGFRDVPGTFVSVFYPYEGVSRMQELQMRSQEGSNVDVCAVRGNFDDAQTAVKRLFADAELRETLAERKIRLSSANSINWGRLLPQIVYYVYTAEKEYGLYGCPIGFSVPTGNFGNILAGYFAKRMGSPIGELFCASNWNDVLTDFFRTGTYDRNRELIPTSSPSMDILVSSNLERLLYLETEDAGLVRNWMNGLNENGIYTVPERLRERLENVFGFGCVSDAAASEAIAECMDRYGYLMDPHTAVGYAALMEECGWMPFFPTVFVSTASPYKFAPFVVRALSGEDLEGEAAVARLEELSGTEAPDPLRSLFGKPLRFSDAVGPNYLVEAMKKRILNLSNNI